jgi:hypothetical protein
MNRERGKLSTHSIWISITTDQLSNKIRAFENEALWRIMIWTCLLLNERHNITQHRTYIFVGLENITMEWLRFKLRSRPVPGKCLGIAGQDPSDSKSNRLHVGIFRLCFHSCEVYSIVPLKWSGTLLKSQTSTNSFSNSTGSSVTNTFPTPYGAGRQWTIPTSKGHF